MKRFSVLRSGVAFLCCILCLYSGGVSAQSFTETDFVCESTAFQDGFLESADKVVMLSETGDEAAAKAKLIAAIGNMDTSVDLSDCNIAKENMNRLMNTVVNEHPEFYYLDINNTTYSVGEGKVKTVDFTNSYRFSNAEIQDKNERIAAEISRILAKVDQVNMSQAEQALVVHDWFALHYEYDTLAAESVEGTGTMDETIEKAFRIDGLFLDKKAVCQGYALGYMYVLEKLGINAIFVPSNPMNHAWNMVEIGDTWYHVDVTWDDPVPDELGYVGHINFLRSDEGLLLDTEHFGWDVIEEAPNEYPGMFWEEIEGEMLYASGKWYYKDGENIVGRTFTGTPTTVKEVTEKWPVLGEPEYVYQNPLFTIGLFDGYIYYNTPTEIRRVSIDGTEDLFVSAPALNERNIYSIMVDGNRLSYRVAEDPNTDEVDIRTIELFFTAVMENNTVQIINMGGLSVGDCFYIAIYGGNELLWLDVQHVEVNKAEYSASLPSLATGDTVYIYSWRGLRPLGEAVEMISQ